MSKEDVEVYKTLVEKNIRLCVKRNEFGISGYEFDEEQIVITISQRTYDKFEKEAEKLGLTVDEALASVLYGRLSDC